MPPIALAAALLGARLPKECVSARYTTGRFERLLDNGIYWRTRGPVSHPPSPPPRARHATRASPRRSGGQRGGKLNDLNPYSLDADGWCDPGTRTRSDAYERSGPPADRRAQASGDEHTAPQRTALQRHLRELRKIEATPLAVEKLFRGWLEHARREEVATLFPVLRGTAPRKALHHELSKVRVRTARGAVFHLSARITTCQVLTPLERERILDVLVDLRHACKTRETDASYDNINWQHACQELGQMLDIAEDNGMSAAQTEDAVLASLLSDAAKLRSNFLTHHIDGAVAAALVLPRFLDVQTLAGRARVVSICQAILEHQVGPPRFMAQVVRKGIEEKLRTLGGNADGLVALQRKIADPLNPAHVTLHTDGYGVLALTPRERQLLALVDLPEWYVPHPATAWFFAAAAVIDGDSLVNYVTPDGVGKIVAICGPGTPFRDATVFHSVFSCGASFVDAVSVMSDTAMSAMRDGIAHTRTALDEMRARVVAEIDEGWLHFTPAALRRIVAEEGVDLLMLTAVEREGEILIDVPWLDGGCLPYWNFPLDYDGAMGTAGYEFAKLLRRRVADLLREV